jgi:hypothetical protein
MAGHVVVGPSFLAPVADSSVLSPAVFTTAPEPLDMGTVTMAAAFQPQLAPPPDPSTAEPVPSNGPNGSSDSLSKVEKLGDAPPSNTLEFLRQQAVLLKCGQWQFDLGLTYTVLDARFAELVDDHGVTKLENIRERLRLLSVPLALRYGCTDDLQAYFNLPVGWSNAEATTDLGDSNTVNLEGVGDISAGFSYHLCKGCGAYSPDVITTLGFIAPTGQATFNTALLSPNSTLGAGYWAITSNVLCVHSIDPLVFYYGGGYVHRFETNFLNVQVQAGEEFDYLFGVGFAINPWVTVSGTMIGSYLTRFTVNDLVVPGSDLDIMRFRFSVTVVKDKRICEPFAEIGMTPESPSRVGVVFTY